MANAGDGRTVEIELRAEMLEGKNTTVLRFSRPDAERATGKQLPADTDVRLTVRFDIEDRNFHWETKRNGGADYHFSTNTHKLPDPGPKSQDPICGFAFTPAPDRQLRVFADSGEYHPQPEWCENIPHPVEQSRGQTGSGDAYSPGWFELPLPKGANVTLVATAEAVDSFSLTPALSPEERENRRQSVGESGGAGTYAGRTLLFPLAEGEGQGEGKPAGNFFETQLIRAAQQFVVRRGEGKTVIAGYPWFLDWGRDSLICARGLLAAGMAVEVKHALLTFAKFEENGTMPNTIHGDDTSNRDTTDAPLWFALACEELSNIGRDGVPPSLTSSEKMGRRHGVPPSDNFYSSPVDTTRSIHDVLRSIATNYMKGTPNGICMDADSALIWSPAHFTWMDTNHPAGTPREGYPIEIQALWIRLVRQLEKISGGEEQKKWRDLANHSLASLENFFWLEDKGWFADVLLAKSGVTAREARPDDAMRGNYLFAVSFGLVTGERAKRCVEAAQKYLVVPGALRSLAPLPVSIPLSICGNDGRLLNNPVEPYQSRYEGDEDTRRKPAYHNGTAWTWTFPVFCEALARAWDFHPDAVEAAKAYLGSMEQLINAGCLGQIPEILDGDATRGDEVQRRPAHTQRGCDAQAWGVTEALRVWKLLSGKQEILS